MKKYIYAGLLFVGAMAATGCEKDVEVYNSPDCYLNFFFGGESYCQTSEKFYSFAYAGEAVQDTVWVQMTTLGYVFDDDRPFELMQEMTGENDAVAGQHYLPFDDKVLRKLYVVPAGAVEVNVPIVLLRDPSLKTQERTLKVKVKENEFFKSGYESKKYVTINFADMLVKPSNWDSNFMDYNFCKYTKGVHQFLIDFSGEKWDEEYIDYLNLDTGFMEYMAALAKLELKKENERRLANGQDILREENGDPVEIKAKSWW